MGLPCGKEEQILHIVVSNSNLSFFFICLNFNIEISNLNKSLYFVWMIFSISNTGYLIENVLV